MTAQEAWKLIDSLCSQINLNREAHSKVLEALSILKPEEVHSGDNGRLTEIMK